MIRIRVQDILNERNLTKYWLFNKMDMSYQNLCNLLNNKTKAIKYKNIELLCEILEVTPDDIFEITPDD